MTKKIFRSLCAVALAVFLASSALIMGVLYGYFSRIQQTQLRMQTQLAAQGVEQGGLDYFDGLDIRDYRITWIDGRGDVLYDSGADGAAMENHLDREEVRQALAEGFGESRRLSTTLTERMLYAAQRLEDGTVLRLAIAQSSVLTMLLGVGQGFAVVLVLTVGLSLILARWLARRIVEPLNELDLAAPLENEGYEEIAPLLRRLDEQQWQLRAQKAQLDRRRDEFNVVTGNMKEGIVLLNPQRRVLSINQAAAELLDAGLSAEGEDILTFNRDPEMQNALRQAERGTPAEAYIHLHGGVYRLSASPVTGGGEISGTALLLLNVTERAQAEAMRRQFTANVSHELKTPLHVISGYAELIQDGMVKQQDIRPFAGKIYDEAQLLVKLVEDIISLSHLDEGAKDMRFEPMDLYAAASEAVEELAAEAQKAGVDLRLTGERLYVKGIPALGHSIVFNLCENGIKYNRPGGHVKVSIARKNGEAILEVSDDGPGIPLEQQEHVFERFYRGDKSRGRDIPGTGLGLSIVKHAVLVMGAEIDLASEMGKGTAVTVRFPEENSV